MGKENVPPLAIKILPGDTAPRYPVGTVELTINAAVITEQGMTSKLPIVDLQLTDAKGRVYFAATSGRIILGLAAALKGVNMRNHGVEEP